MTFTADARTGELRDAHDVLAAFYREHLDGLLDKMPIERAMLGLFCELTVASGLGTDVADVGCGTGRLTPFLARHGVTPRGVDLSPEMVRVSRRDHPGYEFEVADLRDLPFEDASLAGVVCWYSLIFLAPDARERAFGELARVLKPGGHLVTAYKDGDGEHRRAGRKSNLGVEFDAYWLSAAEMERRLADAGFSVIFHGSRPPEADEATPQGYLLVRKD